MVATRFAVALHILLLIALTQEETKTTSEFIARSVNKNPVVVRRITAQLARAGLIRVRRGPGGAELICAPHAISLADIWRAIQAGADRKLLPLHPPPHQHREIGSHVWTVIGSTFEGVEGSIEAALAETTLDRLVESVLLLDEAPT